MSLRERDLAGLGAEIDFSDQTDAYPTLIRDPEPPRDRDRREVGYDATQEVQDRPRSGLVQAKHDQPGVPLGRIHQDV
jgi:hypothetical protein